MGLFDDLLEEDELLQQQEQQPSVERKGGLFDDLLEEEDKIAQPAVTQLTDQQPSYIPYKYDESRFTPQGATTPEAKPKVEEESVFRQALDIPVNIARGGVQGIKMMTDILGADNPISKSLSGVEGYMADLLSAQAKEDQAEISRIMQDAEDKGFGEQVKAGIKAFSIAPVDTLSQALGTMAPVLATGLAGSAAKLGTLGMRAVQAGVGAGMGAGMTKGNIYSEVKDELVKAGIAEENAEKAAVEAQSYGGKNLDQILLGAGLGAASTLGAESIITRMLTKQGTAPTAGMVSRVLKGGITEAIPETAQAAQEQLATNIALQREGFDVPTMRGVVSAGTMEGIAGAAMGGVAGGLERPSPLKEKTLTEENFEATNDIARKVAENGAPLTASAIQDQAATNLRQDELAKQLEAQLEDELVAVKEPTAAPPAIKSKEEFTAIYSQVAPEELTRAEQSFTSELATADTEEARANAQNALEAIKEVKATRVAAPEVRPAKTGKLPTDVLPVETPGATYGREAEIYDVFAGVRRKPLEPTQPAAEAAQPTTTYAAEEIIQPEGVRQEPQDGTQVRPTEEAISRYRVFNPEGSKEKRGIESGAKLKDAWYDREVNNLSSLSGLSNQSVHSVMLPSIQNSEVLKSIVTFIPVNVMNDLRVRNIPADELLNNPDMLRDALSVDSNNDIFRGVIRALGIGVTGLRTELLSRLGRDDIEGAAALIAGFKNPSSLASFLAQDDISEFTSSTPAEFSNALSRAASSGLLPVGSDAERIATNFARLFDLSKHGAKLKPEFSKKSISDSLQPPARGEEEGQVIFGLRSVADNTATREQISALSEAGLVDIVKGKPVINEDGAAILAQPVTPAIVEQEPVTTPAPEEVVTPAPAIGEETDIEAGAPPLGTDNLYFENNLAQRAWRLTAGFKYDKEKGDWFHPDYPNTPRAIAEQEITETNPPSADSVRNTLQQLKVKYGVAEPQVAEIVEPQAAEVAQPEPTTFAKGDLVRIPNRVPVYKNGQLVGGRTEMVGASVVQTMPDGKVEVRLQQGGYATLAPNDIESVRKAQPTPAPVTEQAAPSRTGITEPIVATKEPIVTEREIAPAEAPAPEVAPAKELTEDEAETIRDVITLRKSQGREPNPEQVKRLAEYDAKKAGVEVQAGDIVSNIVVGHPMFESPQPELNNLVPIKVTTKEQLASPIQRAQQVRDKAQSYIGNYQVEQAKAKTPAQKKAFAKKFTPSELTRQRDILDYIKNDVMPELDRLEKLAPSTTPAVSETITEPITAPTGPAVGNRIKLGKSPQTYTIEEVIPQSATEKELGEQYYSVKNEKTGETQVVEKNDMKPVGARKRRMAARPNPLPEGERYGQVKLNRRVQSYFGGKIPDRVYVVDDAVDPEYEYKAAYYPDEGILILNNAFIRKNENIGDIIAHELGHYAFGDAKFKAAFDEFYNSLTPEEKAEVDKIVEDGYSYDTEESQMEERRVIAFTSFTIATPQRRSLWNAVLDAMKAFLNRVFGKNFKMSDPTRTALAMLATAKRRFAAGEEIVREDIQARKMAAQTQDARFAELEARAKAGDKEAEAEAQRMVDEAAKAAGYDSENLLFHGTTHIFNVFKKDRANIENDLGKGYYFTNTENDAQVNYAGEGPDLTNRIERLAEQLESNEEIPREEAISKAKEILSGGEQKIINAYLKLDNPFVIGSPNETFLDYNENYDPETEEYGEPSGKLLEFIENFKEVASKYDGATPEEGVQKLMEAAMGYDGLGASEIIKILKEDGSGIIYAEDSNGDLASSEIIREAIEATGFDGIVDTLVNQKFGSQKRIGKAMAGMEQGTVHTIAFNSNQIKSADPFTYDDAGNLIPLSERFQPTTPDIRRMAAEAEPRRVKVGGAVREESKYITTPKGILAKNTDVIREKFFDSRNVSPENTTKAWGYISRLLDIKSGNANAFAGEINDTVDAELAAQRQALIDAGDTKAAGEEYENEIAAAMFSVELMNYAGRLAEQGDARMLKFLNRNINDMPTGGVGSVSQSGRILRTRLEYDVAGYSAYKAEQQGKTDRTAAALFGKTNPSKEQVKATEEAIKESDRVELGTAEEVATEIGKVEKRTGKNVVKKLEEKIKESKNPKKEELLLSFENLNADKKIAGINITYNPKKIDPAKNIKNLIIGKLVDYRKTLVNQGASGLESTFWQTMSDKERKPGPLGEIDQAQNNELAKIVQKTLIDLGLKGEPPNTKMTDIEKVASILNKQLLSEEKKSLADTRIVAEIERRRQSELETSKDAEAVNQKYDAILDAWNQAMSRQTNMPISDNMLQRLINAELKEQKIGMGDLVKELDRKIVDEKKANIVNSIIRRIYKVSKEAETGVEIDEDYGNLERYLSQTINNMYDLYVEKRNAAEAIRKARTELTKTPEAKAQAVLDSLSRELDQPPPFSGKAENEIRTIVQQDLRQNPDMGRQQPWKSQLTAKLMQAGASEYQAETIANLVWRQHEIKAMDRELKEMQVAAEEGSLKVIIQRIKDTPLEKQQEAGWRESVIKDYLISAGLDSKAADTAAKLYDSVISERLAEAKQKAFEDTLKRSAPWKDYQARNSRLAKDALDKIRVAIRTGVLDPEQTTEDIIAKENGWTGFTKEQYQRIVQLDSIINNPDNDDVSRREAMAQLNQIIVDAKLPVRFKDALGAYYVGNALMGIPTVTVNIASPIGFTIRNLMTDIGRYAFTDPARIPIAFESFLDSMRSWYDQTSYAFKNQIYLNDVVEYLQGQNVLRELFDKGKKQWANGEYAAGFVNMAVGMTQITGRVLSSLDQGAIAMLENQNITRYAMEALAANTKGKVPKDKLKEFANMVLDTKRRVIAENVANGMPRDRAGVLADLAVKSEVIAALSSQDANPMSVLDASINDALLSVGRNKAITIKGAEKENTNLSDEGMLSYLPISFLQTIASGAARQGSAMQIFSKMLYGFALVPARVFHNVAWFSPYGFIRLGVDKYKKSKGQDSPYAMSLQTEAQFKQRLTEAIAGSIVMLGLAALRAGSSDDEDDKKFRIVITGNGPSATTDRQYYDSWNKKWKPYSIHIVIGDTIIPINIGRGGEALFFPIMLAGAMDDWEIKKKQNDTKKEPEDLSMMASMLGSSFFALAQRGPYAAFTKPLFDASKEGRVTEELASQAGYFGKTFIPLLGTSVARNITDFINDPVDRSSIQGAIYANTPIVGPWMGAKALNALGQPVRADDWGDRLFKLGVPVVFSFPKDTPMNELNELILKQGSGPTIPTRTNAQKRFGDILTDDEFETYVREYGKVMSDRMFKNRTKLARMKPSDYDDELEKYARGYSAGDFKIKGASDSAVQAVKRMRQ